MGHCPWNTGLSFSVRNWVNREIKTKRNDLSYPIYDVLPHKDTRMPMPWVLLLSHVLKNQKATFSLTTVTILQSGFRKCFHHPFNIPSLIFPHFQQFLGSNEQSGFHHSEQMAIISPSAHNFFPFIAYLSDLQTALAIYIFKLHFI